MTSTAELLIILLGGTCQAAESRLLSSSTRSSPNYTSYYSYGPNANASGGHPYLSVLLGIVLSAAIFTGFVFFVDRETFDEVIGKRVNCTICRSARIHVCSRTRCCDKPRIDNDDDCAPNISPEFITPETEEYLHNKHDEEVERPKRMMIATKNWILTQSYKYLGTFGNFLPKSDDTVPPSKYDADCNEDKYHIRDLKEIPTDEQTLEDKVAYQLWHGAEDIQEKVEDIRLRMFWKPTKDLDEVLGGKDKYNVEGEEQEAEIQCNSWFEEDANAPWT